MRTLLAALVVSSGCSRPAPSLSNAVASARVLVRMALPHEFDKPTADALSFGTSLSCDVDGDPVPELRPAITAFARDNLMSAVGLPPRSPALTVIGGTVKCSQLPEGLSLVLEVDPRSRLGSLELSRIIVFHRQCSLGGSGTTYCLHVLHDGATTTVVVEKHAAFDS